MRRLVAILITVFILTAFFQVVYATQNYMPSPRKIMVYLDPDLTVEFNNSKQTFRDANGTIVYPIIYNSSAYLPVRAISTLMKEPIEWDPASKTIFVGKTLTNPNKSIIETDNSNNSTNAENIVKMSKQLTHAYLKPDILVMYDFQLQSFMDFNGDTVYPIIYKGTTYLPFRAIAKLMNEPIDWDGSSKTISIGDGEELEEIQDDNNISIATKELQELFEREEILYFEATAKATSIKNKENSAEKQIIASTISENNIEAQRISADVKSIENTGFTEAEILAYKAIVEFAESTEHYILVLENIAYLAAQEQDFSMLADTFLYFAIDSQTKMEDARRLIKELD